jgi:hypothetical protein
VGDFGRAGPPSKPFSALFRKNPAKTGKTKENRLNLTPYLPDPGTDHLDLGPDHADLASDRRDLTPDQPDLTRD